MKKYDFSQHSEYTTGNRAWRGFYPAIEGNAINALNPKMPEEVRTRAIDTMYMIYGYLRIRYDEIDFKGLEAEIEKEEDRYYVSTLFETRDLLPKLGQAIYRFATESSKETLLRLREILRKLYKADEPQYPRRIEELEQRLKSEQS